ncbi:MAG: LPS assembly protein LptD [Desulfobacterales bacterium]|jgi:LPS-assembly protein
MSQKPSQDGRNDKPADRQPKNRILRALAESFFRIAAISVLSLLILCDIPGDASAQKMFGDATAEDADQPWQIEADEINYDDTSAQYIAQGNVKITQGDRELNADYVFFDRQTMKAHARGNVRLTSGNDTLNGDSMDLDLENQSGTIVEGYIFMRENNFHIRGSRIQKLGENTYAIDNASVTTCDGDDPPWLITGKHLKVTIEGYGVIKHAAFWTRNIPVVYTPYLVFPAKLERQTGLLPPQLGSSDRQGFYWIQPFFWAISESSDATVYEHYMAERGHKLGLEYRYMLSEVSQGTFMYDSLDDRKVDDGTGDSSEKYGFGDDDVLRPNDNRYWFRMSHYQALPLEFYAKLNLDIVSDQDYLPEFKYGLTGFFETEKYFANNFNRLFDDYADPVRTNKLNVNRNWDSYSFNLEGLWFDNVINRRFSDTDPTLQKLPSAGFDASKQKILASPLYFDLDSEYSYFYRKDGDKSHRADIQTRVYWPYQYKSYFTLEPSVGLRETVWFVDPDEDINDASSGGDDRFNRQIYDLKLDLGSEISKIFNVNRPAIDRIKHTVLPEIGYSFIPDQDQSDLPQFDPLDRIEEQNLITYSITNLFTGRTVNQTNDPDAPAIYSYRQFGRLKFEQSYDINEARKDRDEIAATENGERQPFSPVKTELDVNLGPYLIIDADAEWDIYDDRFKSANTAITLSDKRNDRLSAEYRFTDEQTESVYFTIHLMVSDRIKTFAEYERNILDNQRIDTVLGISYQSQCWAVELRYIDEPDDKSYEFSINLLGLGDFGD